jgi:hypothetical protein
MGESTASLFDRLEADLLTHSTQAMLRFLKIGPFRLNETFGTDVND